MTTHIKKWRISQFDVIKDIVSSYKIIGIGSLENFPAALLHKLKKNMPETTFKVTNKNVLKKVLEALGHKDIIDKLPNQPILILSNQNAFELYGKIKRNKARSKAKIGMLAPIDFVVPEGDTGLPPGPALSDLKKVGIKAQVRGATIYVPADTTILKQGEVITSDVVSTLSKLNIKPVELVLEVVGVKEDGLIYTLEVLNVDADEIYSRLINAIRSSINLGVEIGYATSMTIEPMIMMAELKAKALEKEVQKKGIKE